MVHRKTKVNVGKSSGSGLKDKAESSHCNSERTNWKMKLRRTGDVDKLHQNVSFE